MPLEITLDVLTSNAAISQRIMTAIAKRMTVGLTKAANDVKKNVGEVVEAVIRNTNTYQELNGGVLAGHFGFINPSTRLEPLFIALKNDVQVKVIPVAYNGQLIGGYEIGILKSDYSSVLGLSTSSITNKGEALPWLEWLLKEGANIIWYDAHINFDLDAEQKAHSRSGQALMFPGGEWKVPHNWQGTEDDNWFTKALRNESVVRPKLVEAIRRGLKGHL